MMKKLFNFKSMIAAAAIMLGAGAGVASAVTYQAPTHYNTTSGTGTPDWQPITPGGEGSLSCEENEARRCKARLVNGTFQVVQTGDYPGI